MTSAAKSSSSSQIEELVSSFEQHILFGCINLFSCIKYLFTQYTTEKLIPT